MMNKDIIHSRIAITGTGICSAIGNRVEEVVRNLNEGRSGIRPFAGDPNEKMTSRWAALDQDFELPSFFPEHLNEWWDRGTQLAATAAVQATAQSQILTSEIARNRIGLAVGVSGSGQFTPRRSARIARDTLTFDISELLLRRNIPHFQLYQIARWLEINGPMTCVCSASAGSGIAISNAMRWLLSDRADAVVAGGGEALKILNFLGFDTLGLLSPNPCSPFSRCEGMTMGEGAGFVVLERWEDATARGAEILGELTTVSITNDAFDPILFDPTGDGLRRALLSAIHDSGFQPQEIDWVRSSGAGGKDQDSSEVMAIREVFKEEVPVVTSTEASFGHCNGAGPAMGIVAALGMTKLGRVPPTLNYQEPTFTGIDFVPNESREHTTDRFLSVTAAFGGTNVILGGATPSHRTIVRDIDEVVVTGLGIIAPNVCSNSTEFNPDKNSQLPIQSYGKETLGTDAIELAALIGKFPFRKIVPSIQARGVDSLNQYAAAAAHKALQQANRNADSIQAEKLGIATGLARTSGQALEKLMQEIQGPWGSPSVGRALLHKGRFLVTSRLANWFGCKSYSATHSGGIGCGQVALNQAVEQLRQSASSDAILVVSADEVSPLDIMLFEQLGWLRNTSGSQGMVLGEGAVGVVLERESSARRRGAKILARIGGTRCSLDRYSQQEAFAPHRDAGFEIDPSGEELHAAMMHGMRSSKIEHGKIDMVLGCNYGIEQVDQREHKVVSDIFGKEVNYLSASRYFGLAHSCSPLQNLAIAIWLMQGDSRIDELHPALKVPSFQKQAKSIEHSVILTTSEDGHNVVTFVHRNSN